MTSTTSEPAAERARRRLPARTVAIAAAAWLVLCIASGWGGIVLDSGRGWIVALGSGCAGVAWGNPMFSTSGKASWQAIGGPFSIPPWGVWGRGGGGMPGFAVAPLWPIAIVLAAAAFFRWRREKREVPPWLCRACGYDLRGTPAAKICPECGASVVIDEA